MIFFGAVAVGAGGGLLGAYTHKVKSWKFDGSLESSRNFARLSEKAPKIQAGSAILISSGATLIIGGIVLASITEQRERFVFDSNGFTLRF